LVTNYDIRRVKSRHFLLTANKPIIRRTSMLFAALSFLLALSLPAYLPSEVMANGSFVSKPESYLTGDTMPNLRMPWMYGSYRINGGFSYGCGDHVNVGSLHDYYAVDFALRAGTPLAAVFSGYVVTGYNSSGLGNWLSIDHGDGWIATFGHLGDNSGNNTGYRVSSGYVSQGQYVGDSGYSGNSLPSGPAGAHLHFRLQKHATDSGNGTSMPIEPLGKNQYGGFIKYGTDGDGSNLYNQVCSPGGRTPSSPADSPYNAAEAVGGWWNVPQTTPDRSIMPAATTSWPINVHGKVYDTSNSPSGYLDKINIAEKVGTGPWQVISTTNYSNAALKEADATAYIATSNQPIYVGFDVYERYSAGGSYSSAIDGFHLSPSGVFIYCPSGTSQSTCNSMQAFSDPYPGQNGYLGYGGGGTLCNTPPATTSSVTGNTPGNHGWWRSPATVTLSATAPCGPSGLHTYYTINGGSQSTYSASIALNQEGIYNVNYYSVDGMGNVENTQLVQVDIDWTPPVTSGTATGPRDTNGIFRDTVTVGLAGTDNLSGVDYEQYSLDGGSTWANRSGANNSFVLSGNGVSRANYRSMDIAGNLEQSRDSGPIIINKYVVFSNATGSSLRFLWGTGVTISGDIFSNGTTYIDGNTGSSLGTTFTTVGTANTITSTNTNTQIPAITTGAASVPMLAYPLSLYQSLATVVFPSDLKLDSVGTTLNSIIYAQGKVDMYDVNLSGPLSIVATGTITDYTTDSTYQTNDPHNGVLMYAGQNVNVNSTGNRNLGLLYAPNGAINVNATNLTLNGSLVGSQVNVNSATTFNLSYNPAFSSSTYSLPLMAMGLVSPTTAPPALPGVPTLYKPVGGVTVSGSGLVTSWSSTSGAVGYQVQISKYSSFSSFDYNSSQLSTATRVNLSSATAYYWRVRAINQAGMSAWSTVGTFRTQ
jgi:murein DD-endopeptidase MepM/ murein hydrolase activator NlpD